MKRLNNYAHTNIKMNNMLTTFYKAIQNYQPISTTGIFNHLYSWYKNFGVQGIIYPNPNFKPLENSSYPKQGVTIYAVHGTGDQVSAFISMAQKLLDKLPGYISSIHLVAFDNRFQGKSISYFSEQLLKKIQSNGHNDVILIGHSRGGLVIAEVAEFFASQADINVHLIYTICSPFGGCYLAKKPLTYFSSSVAEMAMDSSWLQKLNNKISHSTYKYCFIMAESDYIVSYLDSYVENYVRKYPDSKIIFDRHGHLSILSSNRLVTHFHNELQALDIANRPDNNFFYS